jgi:hypothetical protein
MVPGTPAGPREGWSSGGAMISPIARTRADSWGPALEHLGNKPVVVPGLPRDGVPVALEVAGPVFTPPTRAGSPARAGPWAEGHLRAGHYGRAQQAACRHGRLRAPPGVSLTHGCRERDGLLAGDVVPL